MSSTILDDFLLSITKKELGTFEEVIFNMLEFLLKKERAAFLMDSNNVYNKANGYRTCFQNILKRKFTLKIPRDRLSLFKPVLIDLLNSEDQKTNELIFSLYSKGLSTRDIEKILDEVYSNKISSTQVSRISKEMYKQTDAWQKRELGKDYVAIFIDATFIPIRRDTVAKEGFYTLLGLKRDNSREVLGVYNFPGENSENWRECLEDIKQRGVKNVLLFIADGLTGLDTAIAKTFKKSRFQRCIIHKQRNLMNKVRSSSKKEISDDFKAVLDIDNPNQTKELATFNMNNFIKKWSKQYPSIKNMFPEDQNKYYLSFLDFPIKMRRMIYTTNCIENLNKQIKRTTKIRGSFPNEESALNLVKIKCMDQNENNYLKYKLSALISIKKEIDEMFDIMK